ncbi:flagellar export chaperone FliS [Desemzia incerta]|uniref:flagellar export chaperone FliS n=1 Tax=Desemzia incerta TaxID=82801 RepID=UPI00331542D2
MMQQRNAQNVYKQNQILNASPKKLVVLLYDGCIKNMKLAELSITENKLDQAHTALIKSQDIIAELASTLNKEQGGQVAQDLNDIYEYLMRNLIEANRTKEISIIQKNREMMEELRDAWAEI